MLFPLSAQNDKIRLPKATLVLVGLNFLIYFFTSRLYGAGLEAFYDFFGLTPSRVLSPDFIIWYKTFPFLTSMFVHGSLLHVAGNCLFLYVFGSELENRYGTRKYLYFYILSGIYSGLFFVACHWQSPIGVIGASGAISGLMGAVLVLLPLRKIRFLFFSFFPLYSRTVEVPAYICVGLYFVMQVLFGLFDKGSNIAYWGHVGGFVGGFALSFLVLTRPFAGPRKARKRILLLGRTRPPRPQPRYVFVWDSARAIAAGIMRSRTVFRIAALFLIVYVATLLIFYVYDISAFGAFIWAVVIFVLIVLPYVYFLILSQSVHRGLSSFFGSFFSLLYEGRHEHEERPDIYRAQALERKEDYLGAVREYRKIFARFPDRLDVLHRIAELYRNKLKDTRKAVGAYKALLTYPEEGKYAYCVRHAREMIEILGKGSPEHPEPIGVDGTDTDDDFEVGRF